MEPVRCVTCGKLLNFRRVDELVRSNPMAKVLDDMNVHRFCCRRMYISHPRELEAWIREHSLRNLDRKATANYTLRFEIDEERCVSAN